MQRETFIPIGRAILFKHYLVRTTFFQKTKYTWFQTKVNKKKKKSIIMLHLKFN